MEPPDPVAQVAEAKQDVLLRSLEKFYEDQANFDVFRSVLDPGTRVSLRVLDWLVTNYAKKRNIVYQVVLKTRGDDTVAKRKVAFNMFLEYKSQLKAYSKRYFDPFSRRERVWFKGVHTTCGQLNFFKWAMQYGVLDYARKHHDAIEHDMLESIQHRHSKSSSKRRELSKAAIKTCTVTKLRVIVKLS